MKYEGSTIFVHIIFYSKVIAEMVAKETFIRMLHPQEKQAANSKQKTATGWHIGDVTRRRAHIISNKIY